MTPVKHFIATTLVAKTLGKMSRSTGVLNKVQSISTKECRAGKMFIFKLANFPTICISLLH